MRSSVGMANGSCTTVVSFDEDARVDPAAGVRGCRQQWCGTALGDPLGIRANPEPGESEQSRAPFHDARTINLPGQPAHGDTLEHNEGRSRKLLAPNKPVADSRVGRGTLLEVGGTLIAEAGDRIDAAVNILCGLWVFDQPRAKIDEGIQVVDLLQPALGVEPGELGAVKVQGGQVELTVAKALERLETPARLASRGSSAAARRSSSVSPSSAGSFRGGFGRVCLLPVSALAELTSLRAGRGAKD